MYGKPSSFCTTNNRFDSSTIGSLPPKCLWWSECCEWTVSNSSRPHSWASLLSCQNRRKKKKKNYEIWNLAAETKLRTIINHFQVNYLNPETAMKEQQKSSKETLLQNSMIHRIEVLKTYRGHSNQVLQNHCIGVHHVFHYINKNFKILYMFRIWEINESEVTLDLLTNSNYLFQQNNDSCNWNIAGRIKSKCNLLPHFFVDSISGIPSTIWKLA